MGLVATEPLMTIGEYLDFENSSETKHEFVHGKVYAMSGGTFAHAQIIASILRQVGSLAESKGCVALAEFKAKMLNEVIYYPDVLVTCEKLDNKQQFSRAPAVIFEVLSESSESIDRREKRSEYLQLPSLNMYLLVSQTEKRIEVYRRGAADFSLETYTNDGEIDLPGFGKLFIPLVYSQLNL